MPVRGCRRVLRHLKTANLLVEPPVNETPRLRFEMNGHSFDDNVYTRLGVKPLINANLPFTFLSATLPWPEVRAAMDEGARYFIDIGELHRGVGRRLSEISGAESGMVSSGAAGSIALATAACIAGSDPERIWRLPNTEGLKNEVIMWGGRSIFDGAARLVGAKLVAVDSLGGLHKATNDMTAMTFVDCPAELDAVDAPPLDKIIEACKSSGVPVYVDAAGSIPPIDNLGLYARMGVDLYGFSGGKGLRGPQASGLLMGRSDLIEAALANSTPTEGAVCRAMKVGKEEIAGCLAAVEKWLTIDLEDLYREQTRMLETIVEIVESVPTIETEINIRKGSNMFPQIEIHWDAAALGIDVDECGSRLRHGEPPIEVLANYNPYVTRVGPFAPKVDSEGNLIKGPGSPLTVFSLGLEPGQEVIVGRRLREVLMGAKDEGSRLD